MTDLDRVAKLLTSIPIGIKTDDSTGKIVKLPIDIKDDFINATGYFMTVIGAQQFVKDAIAKIDTSDKISDTTVSSKIDTLQNALDTTTA